MRKEYDFTNGQKNPYTKQLKRQVTIKLSEEAIAYFKAQSKETGIPYQTLINLYLTDCARTGKRLKLSWD
ncbi:MAG: BrnA antitoxin family protein [Bacilli bacterium]|nr:BrnA antitoxin family protein [Bacilli bacterium]